MMEWLRTILKKAQIIDGKLDAEKLIKQVQAEFPKHAVPKADYNDKVKALSAANKTIADLKKEKCDNAELQKKIETCELEIANLKSAAEMCSKTYALKELLAKLGVRDPDYLIYKQGGLDKFTFDTEGKPVGVDDVLESYKKDKAMTHLFKQGPLYEPHGGVGGVVNPFPKERFNMIE